MGSFVTVVLPGNDRYLTLYEVKVYGQPQPPMPPAPPPDLPLSAAQVDCVACQQQSLGFCRNLGTCQPRSLSLCSSGQFGNSDYIAPIASEYVAASEADHTFLVGYNLDVLGYECATAYAPYMPPPVPSPPPAPPTPPSPPSPPPPPPPRPPPISPPPLTCDNTCVLAPYSPGSGEQASGYEWPSPTHTGWISDGVCDDGGPGSEYGLCVQGTDCDDCGGRVAPSPPPSPVLPPPSPDPVQPPPLPPATPPPPHEVVPVPVLLRGTPSDATSCATGSDCTFGYALSQTPMLISTTPSSGTSPLSYLSLFTRHNLLTLPPCGIWQVTKAIRSP